MASRTKGKIPPYKSVLFWLSVGAAVLVGIGLEAFMLDGNVAVLRPAGEVAAGQRSLIVVATLLMLLVVVPVFILTFFIAWKYRAGNKSATYSPEWDSNRRLELTWWGIPFVIIAALSVMIIVSSHRLDPYKPLASDKPPLTIQVVALQWKWLFIYPYQDVASVNQVYLPVGTPANFVITADAPMNSFWIPELGGQVYAMAGMTTKLHLMASRPGIYPGSSANLSGEGFADMKFSAHAVEGAEFDAWVASAKSQSNPLDDDAYDTLAEPGTDSYPGTYSQVKSGLYDRIIDKYMLPSPGKSEAAGQAHGT